MTREEILAAKAGRELNIIVAEKVMGRRFVHDEIFGDMEISSSAQGTIYGALHPYSEEMSAADMVIARLASFEPRVEFNHYTENWEAQFNNPETKQAYPVASASAAAEAICKAALLTMLEVKGG